MFSFFVRQKVIFNRNVDFIDNASRIWLPGGWKLAINQKKDSDSKICRHDVIIKFFSRCRAFLVKFSYWSKFHVNIITGSGVMTIFVYKGLT